MRSFGMPALFLFYGVMGGIAALALILDGTLAAIVLPTSTGAAAVQVAVGLVVGVTIVGACRWAEAQFAWAQRLTEEFRLLLGDLRRGDVVAAAALSGVSEELLFRGLLQPALGLWIGAAVFGLLHIGPNRRFVPWTAMAFGVGLVFGALFAWFGSIVAPVVAHAFVNYVNLGHVRSDDKPTLV